MTTLSNQLREYRESTNANTILDTIGANYNQFVAKMTRKFGAQGTWVSKQLANGKQANLYSSFTVPKKNGGQREISAPCEILKALQEATLKLLYEEHPLSDDNPSHGFEPGRSTKTAAAALRRDESQHVTNADIKAAFQTVTARQVRGVFRKTLKRKLSNWQINIIGRICTVREKLATGSPCSPKVLGVILRRFDEQFKTYIEERGGSYIRYADDLTFSHAPEQKTQIIAFIKNQLKRLGFDLEMKKLKTYKGNYAIILGIVKTADRMRTSRRVRRRTRGLARKVLGLTEKLTSHTARAAIRATRARFGQATGLHNVLTGYLSYNLMVVMKN